MNEKSNQSLFGIGCKCLIREITGALALETISELCQFEATKIQHPHTMLLMQIGLRSRFRVGVHYSCCCFSAAVIPATTSFSSPNKTRYGCPGSFFRNRKKVCQS
jgi:hypothetical protein